MLETNKRSLESQLLGTGAKNVKVEGTTLKEFIRSQVAESLAQIKKTKLTWGRGSIPPPVNEKFVLGKIRTDKPYIGPIGRGKYYVQNATVYMANGERLKDLSTISRQPIKEMVQQRGGGFVEMTYPSDWERVEDAMKIYITDALKLDPFLCPYCIKFSSEDRRAMTHHVYSRHPKEFAAEMENAAAGAPDEEPVAAPEATSETAAD